MASRRLMGVRMVTLLAWSVNQRVLACSGHQSRAAVVVPAGTLPAPNLNLPFAPQLLALREGKTFPADPALIPARLSAACKAGRELLLSRHPSRFRDAL